MGFPIVGLNSASPAGFEPEPAQASPKSQPQAPVETRAGWVSGGSPQALASAKAALRRAGYTGDFTPTALASELMKRTVDRVSMDNAFLNATLAFGHASRTTAQINGELAKLLEPKASGPGLDRAARAVSLAAKKLGPGPDNYLRGIISTQTSTASKKRAEDFMTKGEDQHRGSSKEIVAEQAIGLVKQVGDQFREHPVEATLLTAGAVAVAAVATVPAVAAAAATALGASAGTAATVGAGAGVVGVVTTGWNIGYGAGTVINAGKEIAAAQHETGAARDALLQHAGATGTRGAISLVGSLAAAPTTLRMGEAALAQAATTAAAQKAPSAVATAAAPGAPDGAAWLEASRAVSNANREANAELATVNPILAKERAIVGFRVGPYDFNKPVEPAGKLESFGPRQLSQWEELLGHDIKIIDTGGNEVTGRLQHVMAATPNQFGDPQYTVVIKGAARVHFSKVWEDVRLVPLRR